ncbi:hypothetical protein [Streptomyces clavuligerus]|uniref:Uncharacterized protein n=1 Tax=Streptomyces clavuligerus TaxID=1901 RepID=E2PWT7_STRCL|nr:hypothetical protein [Streptomyces clavuligerus]ANW19163.1 hypothetical protein BB341_13510 [Streptomyces clavuligerus]AXU13747.1 hypothetical protein D1794_14005 [Streptomyces clavuligerus]EFG08086.1 Hypothetical protein SCLAV_3015 [Streptomyces clavuligerus]MBY6303723.1 hypothetical protein [Streptomyces clavuligerus]QCS06533.1 hypothetical protein CRV15_13440 [Streptomyces clavuligerus]
MAATRDPLERAEHDLRTLLELGTPRLTAPEGRVGQIRARVVRNRRRRAGAVLVTMSALAVTGLLVPHALQGDPGGVRQSVPPAAPPPLMTPEDREVRFNGLEGLTLKAPAAWHALEVGRDYAPLVEPGGFLGTQRLTARPPSCVPVDEGACPPLKRLGERDVLIRVSGFKAVAETWNGQPFQRSEYVDGFCEQIGGTRSYMKSFAVERASGGLGAVIQVCAGEKTSTATMTRVRSVADSARFPQEGGVSAPTASAPGGADEKSTSGTADGRSGSAPDRQPPRTP